MIADYMPGLWDQHGKGRADGGVLDDLFGVKHCSRPESVRRVRRQALVRTRPGRQLHLEDLRGIPHQGQHLHQGCDRLRQGGSRPADRQGQPRRQGHGRADEPLAAVVQRLPCRRRRSGREAVDVHQARRGGDRPALGAPARRTAARRTATRSPTGRKTAEPSCSSA